MRSILPVEPLKKLFSLFLDTKTEGLAEQEPYQIRMQYDLNDLYIIVSARDYEFQRALMTILKLYVGRIATCFVNQTEQPIFGLIFRDPDEEEALRLRLSIEQALAELYLKTYI
ncbi:MAG: hypothetical protein S4CHLAM123_01900 [Chlamydiales bacterium]|nr:hypothetical protein [Chlamydiales bacterium]